MNERTAIIKKLPKVISSCETKEQLICAQKYAHLAYKKYHYSRVVRQLGDSFLNAKRKQLNAPVV